MTFDVSRLTCGDRVWRWIWVGGSDYNPQPMTVVRVNRMTVTVILDGTNTRLRLPHVQIEGYWTGED